ncbi:DUF6658 family protein [Aliterella atlantica]|uniref:DUF6658 family protein n=1 Tax=Aliterella atlantica TaxID=1827278 RepID=UPI000697E6BA|nr:DUF6658 family protein [Aliterella atlantica]
MSKIIAWVKKIKLSQIVMTFLFGVLLMVSTACNGSVQANTPGGASRQDVPAGTQTTAKVKADNNPRPEVPEEATTNRFEKGTMNEFSDLDPRAKNVDEVSRKAEALKQNAERNVIDQTGDVGENTKRILDKKGENAEDFGKNVQRNTENAKGKLQGTVEDLKRGTQKGTENIKDNTADATKGVNRAAERTAVNAKQAIRENTPDAKELKRDAKQAIDNTKSAGKSFLDRTGDAAKDAID